MYDFVGGKQAWLAAGLPTEGTGVHLALAGEVLVPVPATCDLDSTSQEIRAAIGDDADAACVVTNAHGVVLGRIRAEDLPDGDHVPAGEFMRPGPATVRTIEELGPLVERMRAADVSSILVTDAQGRLLGMLHRHDAEQALTPKGGSSGRRVDRRLATPDSRSEASRR